MQVKHIHVSGTSNQILCGILVAVWLLVAATANQGIAQSGNAHPWLAAAPGEFVRLIDRGNVKIVVDDDRIRKSGKTALTLFQFVVDYDFKFRHQVLGFDKESRVWQAKIMAWIDQPKVRLDHTICIQSNFAPTSPWESKLLQHEFDHVAISTDPRMLKIIKRELQQRRQWVGKWEQNGAPTEQDVRKTIFEAITAEVKSLEQLVQSQYDVLDQESNQGLSDIHSRKDFFRRLYTVEGLERCKYVFNDGMREFVKVKLSNAASQKEVDGHYLFLVP